MKEPRARWFVVALAITLARDASAAPTCDAGAVCADDDKDGFSKCGCTWSGTPCDCNDGDPSIFPGAPERCDSPIDRNCSGAAPERCPKGEGCFEGACVPLCIPLDDFGCDPRSGFFTTDAGVCLCAPNDCSVFGCPAGETCDDEKACVTSCNAGVRCPNGQVCRGFGCVDPCAEVQCPEGAVCDRGRCLPSCTCAPEASCGTDEQCDVGLTEPRCVERACVGVRCPAGEHCSRGRCTGDCVDVVCPPKRVCRVRAEDAGPLRASCVDLCTPNPCSPGSECQWPTGECIADPRAEGGITARPTPVEPLFVKGAGWLCSTSAVSGASILTVVFGVAGLVLAGVRRARRR